MCYHVAFEFLRKYIEINIMNAIYRLNKLMKYRMNKVSIDR